MFCLVTLQEKRPKNNMPTGTTGALTAARVLAAHPKEDSSFLEKRDLHNCLDLVVVHSKLIPSICLAYEIEARHSKT